MCNYGDWLGQKIIFFTSGLLNLKSTLLEFFENERISPGVNFTNIFREDFSYKSQTCNFLCGIIFLA